MIEEFMHIAFIMIKSTIKKFELEGILLVFEILIQDQRKSRFSNFCSWFLWKSDKPTNAFKIFPNFARMGRERCN